MGKVIQKNQLPSSSITTTSIDQLVGTSGAASFQGTVDRAVHHALINQSGVLVNTLTNLIQQVASG
jgi:kynurenine formamidase